MSAEPIAPQNVWRLDPGNFWVELAFDVATPSANVLGALATIGFLDVKLDAETVDTGERLFRFLGRLDKPVILSDVAGLSWTWIQKMTLDAFAPLGFRARPFALETGKVYEVRFLSRDKRAKARGDVSTLLEAVGLVSSHLFLVARNLRVPRRPNVSVSEWLAIGTWEKPASVTTVEEPFFFSDVQEVPS